jgi:ribosomal protein S18 acetylase RimI-like enzyme
VPAPHVWAAEPHEAETVARLMVAFRDHLGRDWPSANAFLAGIEGQMEQPDTEFLLGALNADAPPAGVVQLRYRYGLWRAGTDCHLEDLFVTEDARGAGLGRALVDAAVARARERGCRRLELDVNDHNEAALALYRSLGFDNHDARYGGGNLFMRLHLEAPS